MIDTPNHLKETMMTATRTRTSRHGKPCRPSTLKGDWTFTAETIRRGVTARQLVASGRATTLRQARKLLRRGDRQAAAA